MARAVSIHIGVNEPRERCHGPPLKHSETAAWRMAELAHRAGYQSVLVLRGREATCQAVDDALGRASQTLAGGDILFVSFSGHGSRVKDRDGEEHDGWDETWCLYDGALLDDRLADSWRRFEPGVRLLVVTESCFGGGAGRNGNGHPAAYGGAPRAPAAGRVMRSPHRGPPVMQYTPAGGSASCIGEPPHDPDGMRASLLLLAAAGEDQTGLDGLFTPHLMAVWSDGAFEGTFCELHRQVRERVMAHAAPEPRILMLGVPDPGFPLEKAFHVNGPAMRQPPPVFRTGYRGT